MNTSPNFRKSAGAVLLAWLLFIGVDFLFHGSVLATFWQRDIEAIHQQETLFMLIPYGYASFLLLTVLIYYLIINVFGSHPELKGIIIFAVIFGILFSTSNLLGLYSYINIPLNHLVMSNLVYFIEIIVVSYSIYHTLTTERFMKALWKSLGIFILLVVVGIVVQNI